MRRLDEGFELRWFTPAVEVDLCGHATLAAAYALWTSGIALLDLPIRFQTRSGQLSAVRRGELIELDFPATPPEKCDPPAMLLDALETEAVFVGKSCFDSFVVLDSASRLRALRRSALPGRGRRRASERPLRAWGSAPRPPTSSR